MKYAYPTKYLNKDVATFCGQVVIVEAKKIQQS